MQQQQPGRCRKAAAAAAAVCPRKGSSSLDQQSGGSGCSSSWASASSGSRPQPPSLNANSCQQHSPATSPGGSSTHSRHSFHFHHLSSSVANLRKSGVNLVKNLPINIRRSSLAMFQMRAMGPAGSTGLADEEASCGSRTAASGRQHRLSADSGASQAETLSLYRQRGLPSLSEGRKRCSNAGTAAKRAMRKRISAAKLALRKISRLSSNSCGSAGAVLPASSCSTSISSPKTMHSPFSSLAATNFSAANSLTGASCSSELEQHPLRKCVSSQRLPAPPADATTESRLGMAATMATTTTTAFPSSKDQFGSNENRCWLNKSGGGGGAEDGKEPKKKRSWAATFVMPGCRTKAQPRAAEQQQQQGREAGQRRRPMLEAGLDCQQRVGTKGAASGRKQPLRPSLSWDPQQQQQKQRSRTSSAASQTSRSRIHSDGSANRQPIGSFPPLLSKYNIAEFHSQPLGICEEQQNKEKLRQFEKRTQQQQQQKISGLGKRRKKSSSQSALALCKGSRSNSLSTVGPAELDTAADNQQKSALELNCLHCALQAEYRSTNLRAEIECAVKRLAARLSNSGSPARTRRTLALGEQRQEKERRAREEAATTERQMELLRRQMGTPDIVVSSCNSEDTLAESADEGFWTNSTPSHTTTNNHRPGGDSGKRSACCSSVATSPVAALASSGIGTGTRLMNDEQQQQTQRHDGNGVIADHLSMMAQVPPAIAPPMDTLKPPGFPFGLLSSFSSNNSSSLGSPGDYSGGGGSSPPRSNSVDLSQLRRDIELWSVSSTEAGGHGAIGDEERPGTAGISTPGGDSIRTVRSRSYDPSSSPEHMLRRPSRIEHLSDIFRKALAKSPVVKRAAIQQEQEHNRVSKHRTSRYWLEENLCPSEHIWLPSSSASSAVDTECYLGEKDCEKLGEKRRCAACHIVAHTACFPLLAKMNLSCKSTFRDCASSAASRRQQSKEAQDSLQKHHWVHRWRLEGRCFHCGKSFQQKMFREKEVIAITCSWCKRSYHNKRSCFSLARFDDHCDRGALREMILPPSWLLRLGNQRRHRQPQQQPSPQRQQQQQQLAQQQRRNGSFSCKEQDKEQQQPVAVRKTRRKYRPFIVKPQLLDQQQQMNGAAAASQPIPLLNGISFSPTNFAPIQPLLVFVNPKSGGNKGAKVLNTLTWLLNPRQVFDITAMRGPKYGLEMFRKMATHQLRILVCGGDGTVGWVLSSLDLLNWPAYPAICLLPTGTGNDLSRSMGWGGTFSDEPLAEVLQAVQTETSVTYLDRWRLNVFPLPCSDQQQPSPVNSPTNFGASNEQPQKQQQQEVDQQQQQQQPPTPTFGGAEPTTAFQTTLPLAVMNNYFSIGADAHVALQFHHSRSANPQMLNSRLKNRIAYGGLGTIDLFKRTWKDLSDHIRVECDGVDISPKIRDFKFHCLLFHNIGFYAGGTIPWGQGGDGVQESCGEVFSRPSPCDGKIEVLGFTTATLAALQMGGKGERIAQCSKVRIETLKPIPMQVDGEPCLLGPSLIHLSFHNKVPMLRREKFARMSGSAPANNIVSMNANRRKSSNNSTQTGGANSSGGGGSPSITQHHHHQTTATGTMATAPPPASQHKSSRASLYADTFVRPTAASPPNSVFMCVPVVVVGRHDYDTYRDTVDRLKDTGFELGTLNVEAEMELGQVRQLIQQLLAQHQILPYEPGREWRFLDYVSNSEEGTFRISRQQEQSRTVADVCSLDEGAGILILDDAFPSMTVRSATIGHELVFSPAHGAKPISALDQNMLMRRRISETLRIVLSSESQETHL